VEIHKDLIVYIEYNKNPAEPETLHAFIF